MIGTPARAFYLPAQPGQRLCIYHRPAVSANQSAADCVLHIHAFAEEMNKCRRTAALTAQQLACAGLGVLQIDLYGCGDSSADFADAEWEIWQQDLRAGLAWLKQQHGGALHIWADRLGALLALDFILAGSEKIDQLLLCQPVLDGGAYLKQLSRIQQARTLLNDHGVVADPEPNQYEHPATQFESAGYTIAATLRTAIAQHRLDNRVLPVRKIHWLEMSRNDPPTLSGPRRQLLDQWRQAGNNVALQLIHGPAYWQTPELSVSQPWVEACSRVLTGSTS